MPETIYECPRCGLKLWTDPRSECAGQVGATHYPTPFVPVRVFREEDVRPVVEAAREVVAFSDATVERALAPALDAFPAPEEWTA